MFIQTGSAKKILCKCISTNFELASKFTSYSLYYRKLDESSAKQYFRITDVYSNCDATRYCGVAISNLGCEQSEQYNIT